MNSIINKIEGDGFVDSGDKYIGRIFKKKLKVHTAVVQLNKKEDALISFYLRNDFTEERAVPYTKYDELIEAIKSKYPNN